MIATARSNAGVGLPSPTLLARESNTDAHHHAIAEAARAAGVSGRSIGLCGGAALIQGVRAALRAGGVEGVKVKAYWAPGKVGLD